MMRRTKPMKETELKPLTHEEVAAALRAAKSTRYRGLYDTAADMIEALVADLRVAEHNTLCDLCVHGQDKMPCIESDVTCDACPHDCKCKKCRDSDLFEWRGVQKKKQPKPKREGRK
jgi:hypothetical protein